METHMYQNLLESVERFPQSPGVYIMKDARDLPLYIGKALNLKSRVKSYFSDTHAEPAAHSRYAAAVAPHRMDGNEQRIGSPYFRGQSH